MQTAIFSTRPYDKSMLSDANREAGHDLRFLEDRLTPSTVALAAGCAAVCVFSFSLGEVFPLLSLNLESRGVSPKMIGLNAAMGPVGILLAGAIVPKLSHAFGPKAVALCMAMAAALIFLTYPTFPTLWAWFPLRLLQGVCVATLFALSEAWVLGNATGSKRGMWICGPSSSPAPKPRSCRGRSPAWR